MCLWFIGYAVTVGVTALNARATWTTATRTPVSVSSQGTSSRMFSAPSHPRSSLLAGSSRMGRKASRRKSLLSVLTMSWSPVPRWRLPRKRIVEYGTYTYAWSLGSPLQRLTGIQISMLSCQRALSAMRKHGG